MDYIDVICYDLIDTIMELFLNGSN